MRHEDRRQFHAMMIALAEYYGRELSDGVTDMYWNGLEQHDLDAVRTAFNRHTSSPDSGQFFPKIADVVKMLAGSTQDTALRAWAKVDRAVRHAGTYSDVAFDDALIHRVINDMGGWIALGAKTETEWPFTAREFENRYRGYKSRGETPEYPPVLTGIANMHNRKGGYRLDPVKLIGNTESASAVMLSGTEAPLIGFATVDHLRLTETNKPNDGFDHAGVRHPIDDDEKTRQIALEVARRAYLEGGEW